MNQTFNLKRFGLLFKKTIAERPAQLIGLTGLVLVFTFVAFFFKVQNGQWFSAHVEPFIWGLVGGGVVLSSMVFNYFNTNANGTSYLTLPVSAFEKWLCGVLIIGILFTAIFLGFYRLIDYCFVTIYHNGLDKTSPLYQQQYDKAYIFNFNSNVAAITYTYFFNLVGVTMLGCLYFNKAAFIKTALAISAFIFIIWMLNSVAAHALIPNVNDATPFRNVFIEVNNNGHNLDLPKSASSVVSIIGRFILPAILWITAYIRLKEKEI